MFKWFGRNAVLIFGFIGILFILYAGYLKYSYSNVPENSAKAILQNKQLKWELMMVALSGITASLIGIFSTLGNRDRHKELLTSYVDLKNRISGGNSFCFIKPIGTGHQSQMPKLFLVHVGDYPIYNIVIYVHDTGRRMFIAKREGDSLKHVFKNNHELNKLTKYQLPSISHLHPGAQLLLEIGIEDGQTEFDLTILIRSSVGEIKEELRMKSTSSINAPTTLVVKKNDVVVFDYDNTKLGS